MVRMSLANRAYDLCLCHAIDFRYKIILRFFSNRQLMHKIDVFDDHATGAAGGADSYVNQGVQG